MIPTTIAEEPETIKLDDDNITQPIEVSDVVNVQPVPREVKVMHLVKCEKCNRKMLEQTLKYKHQESCPGNKSKEPKQPKTKDIKVEPIEDIEDIEPPAIPPLRKSTRQCAMSASQNKINQKKEQYKSLIVNVFCF